MSDRRLAVSQTTAPESSLPGTARVCSEPAVVTCSDSHLPVNVARVIRQAGLLFGYGVADIKSGDRSRALTQARHVAMHAARQLTGASLPTLGRNFGGRDHSSVFHAIKRVEATASLRGQSEDLQAAIGAAVGAS